MKFRNTALRNLGLRSRTISLDFAEDIYRNLYKKITVLAEFIPQNV